MAQWVITARNYDSDSHPFQTVKKFEGTLEEARAELRAAAESHPLKGVTPTVRRRMVFRYGGEDAYYLRVYGKFSRARVVLRLAELLSDTDWSVKGFPPEPQDEIPPGWD